ncbi:MAG: ABC transporter ATP-binding protein/permease [Clostridiales bacterium]|nr:ABC transporter ATP-binding protein/permease [Clostridiales bacterium]
MLELKQIVKDYPAGTVTVHALKGVDLRFRTSEFVSILGPSGCGKTTLLNIIGGLDQYTSGDLVIDGVSTKNYKDRDWDTYRNHSIGFVFQTYNLIPHQTVLKNVELALTLAGTAKAERRERAIKALEKVGLGDQINKRPNQMSGGQMQRVAIARALVNNPDIILADEPTGALDTETGLQVMELLREVAKDRLVVMVTHNPELAEQYSSRIIRILDGVIVGDTAPMSTKEYQQEKVREYAKQQIDEVMASKKPAKAAKADKTTQVSQNGNKKTKPAKKKRSSMSFWTAFKLSLTNLFTKKGRTFLTSFAGSIGIIGIALILSVSAGMTQYINMVQEQTLSTYPLSIQSTAMDLSSIVAAMMSSNEDQQRDDPDRVYQRSIVKSVAELIDATAGSQNDLNAFKKFLEKEVDDENSKLHDAIAGLQYQYNLNLRLYGKNAKQQVQEIDTRQMLIKVVTAEFIKNGGNMQQAMGGYASSMATFSFNLFEEILSGTDGSPINRLLYDQYDVVYGNWPVNKDEVVLIMNENNEISDIALYALGILGDEYIDSIVNGLSDDGNATAPSAPAKDNWSYAEMCQTEVVVILNSALYEQKSDGTWYDATATTNQQQNAIKLTDVYNTVTNGNINKGLKLKISGIIRPNPDATAHMLSGAIGYTKFLRDYVVEQSENNELVQAQMNDTTTDLLTGKPFATDTTASDAPKEEKAAAFKNYYNELEGDKKLNAYVEMLFVDGVQDQIEQMWEQSNNNVEEFKKILAKNWSNDDPDTEQALLSYLSSFNSYNEIVTEVWTRMEGDAYKQPVIDAIKEKLTDGSISEEMLAYMMGHALDDKSDERCALYYDKISFSSSTWESNMAKLGWVDLDTPSVINIYASSFDAKDVIADEIARYNSMVDESQQISYTDFVAIVMSAVTTIIDAITYVLIAFVSISLIVSSIMIGVITLISVQERTKEIGILRAIGASKRDVSSMFNAETVIIGFAAGLIGVVFTYVLCIPINLILHALTGIATLSAYLPPVAALILIAISVLLTLISGIIPSRSAAKKDPVVALRTE